MAQDGISGVLGAPRGPGGTRVSRGVPGHKGALMGSGLPLVPESVIKQQNDGHVPWLKVPKVCPDPKGMVFIHF